MEKQNQYEAETTIQFPGMTVRVHRPILTAEERAARMRTVHKQAAELLKGVQTK